MSDNWIKLNSEERSKIICALEIYSEYLEKKEMFTRSDEVDELRNLILNADYVGVDI